MKIKRFPVACDIMAALACAMLASCSSDNGPGDDAAGTNVVLSYCDDRPLWLAVQDGAGPWKRVLPTGEGRYEVTFKAARGGVATMHYAGAALHVNYGDLTELATIACDYGDKYLTGKLSPLTWPQFATITLGAMRTTVQASRDSFRLWGIASGPQDLIAIRQSEENPLPERVVIRRALNPPSNSSLPTIVFDSSEGFAPVAANFTVSNVAGSQYTDLSSWWLGRGAATAAFTWGELGGATSGQYVAVPLEQLGPGEMSSLTLSAVDAPAARYAVRYFRAPTDIAIAVGPPLTLPVVSVPASAPYLYPRVQLQSQTEYGRMASVSFSQDQFSVRITMTSSYQGGTPATWTLDVPDLSSVDGWNEAWGLSGTTAMTWSVMAEGGVDRKLGDVLHEGDVFNVAYYDGSSSAAASRFLRGGMHARPPGGFPQPERP